LFILVAAAASVLSAQSDSGQNPAQAAPTQSESTGPVIQDEPQLPETYVRAFYEYQFHVRGGVPAFHWHLEKGSIPPGLKLEDNGLMRGLPERSGEFQFTISVKDSGSPQQTVQKACTLRVRSALTLNWKTPAHVSGNRIDGSVNVSNATPDDMDLTLVVMAVAGNGRATAIGYQHFVLTPGTLDMELPFGDTLPNGGYVVHVDVVGEVAKKNLIYRERMQTPSPLHVTVGP
jgi:hypothetical protein